MKKLVYCYSKIGDKIHTKFISNKTMLRESKDSNRVEIYECNEVELWQRENGFVAGKYITTIALPERSC